MSTNSEANKRIAKNAMLLYIRMGVMMIISFFTAVLPSKHLVLSTTV